jgi:diguanylate cyclase (GGDEF)-like protein
MNQYIRKIGLIKTVCLFSFFGVCISIAITLLLASILPELGLAIDLITGLIMGVVIALIITPVLSFYLMRLFLKVDQLKEDMKNLATHDTLTGLLTKSRFLERANYFHKIAVREKLPYALIMADLDNYKDIIDKFGHMTGDKALESVGVKILEERRESDLACRFGGGEFLFFLPNTTAAQAEHFCERMRIIINNAFSIPSLSLPLTASMGIAAYPDTPTDSVEDFIFVAERAMYLAKKSGGDQTQRIITDK